MGTCRMHLCVRSIGPWSVTIVVGNLGANEYVLGFGVEKPD